MEELVEGITIVEVKKLESFWNGGRCWEGETIGIQQAGGAVWVEETLGAGSYLGWKEFCRN